MQKKEYSMNFAGKPLAVEFTDLADQADGSVLVTHGKTKVFASAVMSKKANQSAGWFPLVVNYEEKFYSAGKILGSRFMRREGRPSDEATLTSRIIDRTIRPLFNHSVRNEIQIIVYALTVDGENDTDIPAVIAASLAIATSDIPWGGPVGATRICLDENGGFVINGNHELREKTKMDIIVCGGNGKLNMIEAGAKEVDEKTAAKAIAIAQEEINKLEEFQQKIISEIGKPKRELDLLAEPSEMQEMFDEHIYADLEKAIYTNQKSDTSGINDKWHTICEEKFGEEYKNVAEDKFEKITDSIIHKNILENDKRPDGRKMDEIRHLYA
ncbi:MAG: polyribonucleotide nucleotidyltransferase, partial [Candidatus Levybacteria bacterium CG10_big_fil_rev_8_21_14_0_10_36_7]